MSIKLRPLSVLIAISVLAVAVVACGGDDDDDVNEATIVPSPPAATEPAESPTEAETPATGGTAAAGDATVSAGTAGLVDIEGYSLYVFANDTPGVTTCVGGCAAAWPPSTIEGDPTAGDGVTGELGTIARPDDATTQVTYNGMPLYRFVNDAAPGETNGKDVPNWSLAQP